jgi:hypothetical protein
MLKAEELAFKKEALVIGTSFKNKNYVSYFKSINNTWKIGD